MTYVLVANRLIDMVVVHPQQDNTKRCGRCLQLVGIYPSSQRALRDDPAMEIICTRCFRPGEADSFKPAARSLDEYRREQVDSVEVNRG